MQVSVRDNNVDQALRALKKKLQREGVFREMKLRQHFEKPSVKKAREKAEAIRRARKLAREAEKSDALFVLTHNYTGYPMVKEARERVRGGSLGRIRKVVAEVVVDAEPAPGDGRRHRQLLKRNDRLLRHARWANAVCR